jgi:hypothetical protein
MKKIFAAVFAATLIAGCASTGDSKVDLSQSFLIERGMTKGEVLQLLGNRPATSEFKDNVDEWHFCRTGWNSDSYVAVYFIDGRVTAKREYTRNGSNGGGGGNCKIFIKSGDYREPDEIREYRIRYRRG